MNVGPTLTTETLAPLLQISVSTLRKILCDPKRIGVECPLPLKIPNRGRHVWLTEAVFDWMRARVVDSAGKAEAKGSQDRGQVKRGPGRPRKC